VIDHRPYSGLARAVATMVPVAGKPDRWVLNSGAEMALAIHGISLIGEDGEPEAVRAVIDLSTFQAADATIIALRNHDRDKPLGSWSGLAVDPEAGFAGNLALAQPSSPTSLPDAREIADLLAVKSPLQASVGMRPDWARGGQWEKIPAGQSVQVNGRTVTFGADSDTGRMAAAARRANNQPSKGNSMSDFKRLGEAIAKHDQKHHGAIAQMLVKDPAISDEAIARAIEQADTTAKVTDLTGQLAAMETRAKSAETERDTLKTKVGEQETAIAALKDPNGTAAAAARAAASGTKVPPTAGSGAGEAPKTQGEAQARLRKEGFAEGKANRGMLIAVEARKRWPNAESR
jgi:hypothetical protein